MKRHELEPDYDELDRLIVDALREEPASPSSADFLVAIDRRIAADSRVITVGDWLLVAALLTVAIVVRDPVIHGFAYFAEAFTAAWKTTRLDLVIAVFTSLLVLYLAEQAFQGGSRARFE